ncbi:MAG: hypothetical protein LBR87_06275 [Synergistaceae bacterium]|jgi:uroporphyrinogen decarboxylase|nr:hypothetical protein [Synergistaceae bacterium]
MSGKSRFIDYVNGSGSGRAAAGFWFHFAGPDEYAAAPGNPGLFRKTLEGHKRYFESVGFEIMKIMSEGYFVLPGHRNVDVNVPDTITGAVRSSPDDPWFAEQIGLSREISRFVGDGAAVYYTIFSPFAYLSFSGLCRGEHIYSDSFAPGLLAHPSITDVLDTITRGVSALVERILTDGEADGIFFAVRAYEGVSAEDYRRFIEPGEREVLRRAAEIRGNTILHICGDTRGENDFQLYASYEASAYNWAFGQGLSLSEGRRVFGGRTIMGGFDSTRSGELYRGDREAVERRAGELLDGAGGSLILGADCALPPDINCAHLRMLRDFISSG